MFRGPVRVVLALLSGALICLAAPASAVAHGHTHAELLEHAADDHGAGSHGAEPSISEEGHHDAHAHATIDKGVSSRTMHLASAVLPRPAVHDFASDDAGIGSPAPVPFESPPDPHDKAPTHSRAPPIVSAF